MWSRRGASLMGVTTLLGAILCAVPLFDLLGYESAALVGLVLGLLGPILWLSMPMGGWSRMPEGDEALRPTLIWSRFVGVGVWLAMPPLLLVSLNAARVPNCALGEGAAFWGLIVGGSVAMASLWALLACILARPGWRRWMIYLAFFLASVLTTALYLLLEPPVRAHNALIGLFAGSIYDEALEVPLGLIHYRVWHAVVIVAALCGLELAWVRRRRGRIAWGLVAAMVALSFVAVGMHHSRAALEMELDRDEIEAQLGGRYETEHFVIHYPLQTWHGGRIEAIGDDHEFRFDQLVADFGRAPMEKGERIHSYIYAHSRQKGELLGMRRTMIARLWLGEIHILYRQIGQPVLKHELVHIFSAPYGSGPLSLSMDGPLPNMGLVEGLAEALTWQSGDLTPHVWSAAMRRMKIAPDVRDIVGAGGFYTRSGRRAYTLMGSFCRFLIDEHGLETLLEAYAKGDLEAAYETSVDELVGRWEAFVDGLEITDEELGLAEYYLDQRSIFEKRCARKVGALRVEGADKIKARRLEEAVGCYEAAVAFSPRTAGYRLELANVLLLAGRHDEASVQVEAVLAFETLSRSHRARALERRADLLAIGGRRDEAAKAYGEVLALKPTLGRRRSAQAKRLSLGQAQALTFFHDPPSPVRKIHALSRWIDASPDSALAHYLLGRQLWGAKACAEALPELGEAVERVEALPGAAIRTEARRLLGICQFHTGEYEAARRSFEVLSAQSLVEGQRLEGADWIERVEWARDGR